MLKKVFKFAYGIAQVLLAVSVLMNAFQIVSAWSSSIEVRSWKDLKPVPSVELRNGAEIPADTRVDTHETERSRGKLVFSWLLFCLFLPVATYKPIECLLEHESNYTNAGLLAGYSAIDTALAFALMDFQAASFFPMMLLILAAVLAVGWNYVVLDYVDRNRSALRAV